MKKLLALLLAVVLIVGLCACGSSGKGGMAGHYTLTLVEEGGQLLYSRDISGENYWLELKSDGTGTLCTVNQTDAMGWGNGLIWPMEEPEDTANLTVSGKTLKIEADDFLMVFEKN
jgi:hypothetical protein